MGDLKETWVLTRGNEFIGGDMSLDGALSVAASAVHGRVLPVPKRYSHPHISEAAALDIAVDHLRVKVAELPSNLSFGEVHLRGQDAMRYSSISFCKQWVDAGKVPGGLTFSVDRVDGHIWSSEDTEHFMQLLGRE